MAEITWKQGSNELTAFGRIIQVSCDVRNEINRRRLPNQIALSMPDKHPYQPRIFPKGLWFVGKPVAKADPYMAPFFIPTDAWQELPIWETDKGQYTKKTGKFTHDVGYGLHFSTSMTTLGCIKIIKKEDLIWLANEVDARLKNGEKITMEVS